MIRYNCPEWGEGLGGGVGGCDLLGDQWQINDVTAPLAEESPSQYLYGDASDEKMKVVSCFGLQRLGKCS